MYYYSTNVLHYATKYYKYAIMEYIWNIFIDMEDNQNENAKTPAAITITDIKAALIDVIASAAQPQTPEPPQITHITPDRNGVYRPSRDQWDGIKSGTVKIQGGA